MSTILVIDSAATGEASVSRTLVREAVAALKTQGATEVVYRDLDAAPIPHLTQSIVAGIRGVPASEREQDARALSDALIAELRAADTIVIGAPMYNFSVPTTLRAWFDHVLRAGETFRYTEKGPQGLLARQEGDRRREPRRPLQRRPGARYRLPGALPAPPPRLHGPDRRHLRPRREARLRPRGPRRGDRRRDREPQGDGRRARRAA